MPIGRYRNARGQYAQNPRVRYLNAAVNIGKKAAIAAGSAIAATMAQKAYNYATKPLQVTKRRAKRRRSFITGKSGGKVSKRFARDTFATYSRRGVVTQAEFGCSILGATPTYPVFVGHATHGNVYLVFRTFWRAVVRDLYARHGMNVSDMEVEYPGTGTVTFSYKFNTNASVSTSGVATVGLTYNQIAGTMSDNWFTIMNSTPGQSYVELLAVEYDMADGPQVKLSLRSAKISVYCKSDLKCQNRTVANGTDEDRNSADNIANQPLYGKSYYGIGSGLTSKVDIGAGQQGKSLVVGEDNALLAYSNGDVPAALWLREPPPPTLFYPTPKVAKLRIEPAEIKTSSLSKTHVIPIQEFINTFLSVIPGVTPKGSFNQNRFGKFAIMAMEKIICTQSSENAPTVGLELQQKIGVYVIYHKQRDSAPVNEAQKFLTAV